jgi:hypothetical protein
LDAEKKKRRYPKFFFLILYFLGDQTEINRERRRARERRPEI